MALPAPDLPPIFFNHLYIVLDDKTYHAIQGSDFLRIAFPGMERRATLTGAGETWSGTYFYCQENYLEFFGSGNGPVTGTASRGGHWQAGAQEGWAGLAFSADRPGGVAAVRQALSQALNYQPFTELRQMRAGDKTINWFYHVKLAETLGLGSFESWVMEYHPDVFGHKGLPLPTGGELTRQAYLAPWNKERVLARAGEAAKEPAASAARLNPGEAQGKPSPQAAPDASGNAPRKTGSISHAGSSSAASDAAARAAARTAPSTPGSAAPPVFSRVTGATIHMDSHRAGRFAEILALLGYTRQETDTGLVLSAHGFRLSIRSEESAPGGYRLSALRLAMSRPSVAPMTFVFAPRSRLILKEDLTAEWEFGL